MNDANDDFFLQQAPIANAPDDSVSISRGVVLTDSQKKTIDAEWRGGATSLKHIVQVVFPGKDGRSDEGKAVKKYLATSNRKAQPAHIYVKKSDSIVLDDDQKDFIASSASTGTKTIQITRDLYNDQNLTSLSSEFRAVKTYYDTLDPKVRGGVDKDDNISDYNPPKNEIQAIARVNKYVLDGVDKEKITPKQRESLSKLIKFTHTFRFIHEISVLPKISERELFESSFVRFVWDKPDLTEEEIDLYINLCSDIISYQRMQQELIFLTEQRDIMMSIEQKLPMAIVEAIGKLRGDIDAIGKKQEKTLQALNGKRSDRLDKIQADNASVLTLVDAFRDAEKRKRFIEVVEVRKEKVKKEAERLESIDELVFELFGASKSELTQ